MAWTTLAQEEDLLADAEISPRVSVELIGQSLEGRPIRRVRIGDPTPHPITDRAALLVVGCQHGHEPAGREAMLQLLLPQLIDTSDSALVSLMQQHNIVLVPTANPDGFAQVKRENAADADVNRDHITLAQPEARALARLMGQCRPLALLDCHETTSTQTHGDDVAFRPSSNPQISDEVLALSSDLLSDVQDRMTADGWSHSLYGSDPPSGRENRLLNNAGLRHSASLLIETLGFGGSALPEDDRRDIHHAVMDEALAWLAADLSTITSDVDDGIAQAITDGENGTAFDLHTGTVLDPAPLGYLLSGSLLVALVTHLEVFGVAVSDRSVVAMGQRAQPVIPHLMDPDGPSAVVSAERLDDLSDVSPDVPAATVADFAPVVSGSHLMVVEARVLTTFQSDNDPDGEDLPILAGDVTLDGTAQVRGSLELETLGIDRDTGRSRYPRRPSDLLAPYGNEIFVRRGVDLGSEVLWSPLGYFRIESAEQDGDSESPIRLSGQDRMGGIVEATLLRPREYSASTPVASVFADLIGDVHPDATVVFDDDSGFADIGRVLVVDESRYEPLREIADGLGKIFYVDGEGVFRVEDAPSDEDVVWEVRSGRGGVLLSSARRVTREGAFNAVLATGEGADQDEPVSGVAVDNGPNSPTRWGGRFGRVPIQISSPTIRTTAQAQRAAAEKLRRNLGAPHSADFSAVPNPALRPHHVVRVTARDGNRDVHVVESVVIPLVASGALSATTRERTHVVIGAEVS